MIKDSSTVFWIKVFPITVIVIVAVVIFAVAAIFYAPFHFLAKMLTRGEQMKSDLAREGIHFIDRSDF